jgi:hypothetical protein
MPLTGQLPGSGSLAFRMQAWMQLEPPDRGADSPDPRSAGIAGAGLGLPSPHRGEIFDRLTGET